jgi:3,4-dihydroxy 2-butanone 4-phosphate synthase/GTP cyclohydrolase II
MTNNPQKVNGLAEYGIEVVERVPIIIDANPLNKKYLHTKKEKLGHMMEQEK